MKKFLPEAGFSGRVMRRLAVLLAIWTAGLSAIRAQQSQQTIAVNFRNATVQQVFTWLDNHTQYDFVYNNSQIESLPRVSMQMSRTTVVDVVKHCLRNSSLSYQIRGNMVVIRPADEIKKGTEEAVQFSGVVYDENGLPLAGVSVVLKQASRGAVTGPDGKFTLKARRSDDMTLSFSFLGMKNQEIAVFNNGKQVFKELDKINVHMDPAVSEIGNVVVTGILNIAQKSFSGSSTAQNRGAPGQRPERHPDLRTFVPHRREPRHGFEPQRPAADVRPRTLGHRHPRPRREPHLGACAQERPQPADLHARRL